MGNWWFTLSTITYALSALAILFSGYMMLRLLAGLLPVLDETRGHIQDLGDLTAHTVGRAAESMDIVELRVSQTMGQATQAGVSVSKQAVSVGSVLAGLYFVSRVASLLRGGHKQRRRSRRR